MRITFYKNTLKIEIKIYETFIHVWIGIIKVIYS